MVTDGANGISVYAGQGPVLRGNIIHVSGSGRFCIYASDIRAIEVSDYNDLFAASGAKVGKVYEEEAQTLAERIGSIFPRERIMLARLGPGLGVHGGPGVLAISFREKEPR